MSFDGFERIYLDAYDRGLKGCTTYRPNPVTGAVLVPAGGAEGRPQAATAKAAEPDTISQRRGAVSRSGAGAVVYMAEPLERDQVLSGFTYKLRWPESDHAMYVTINDIVTDGRRRPFEIFINSKNLEHYAWTVALTRMISAVFRRGGDVTFVVDELKAVFDPRGGQWMSGHYVPSLLAAIGEVIEKHMIATGFLTVPQPSEAAVQDALDESEIETTRRVSQAEAPRSRAIRSRAGARGCPRCGKMSLRHAEGCWTCAECGYSKCS
jgi:ribonucleoside-diphosphate reductase alpha chain